MSKTFIFYPNRCVPPASQLARRGFDGVLLSAGANILDDDIAAKVENHPDFEQYLTWKAIEVKAEVDETKLPLKSKPKSLAKLSIEQADSEIEAVSNLPTLQGWLKTETRVEVKESLERRIKELL